MLQGALQYVVNAPITVQNILYTCSILRKVCTLFPPTVSLSLSPPKHTHFLESSQNFVELQVCINPYFVMRNLSGSDSNWANDKNYQITLHCDSSCLLCQCMGLGPHLTTSASHGILICVSALVHFCAVKEW